MIRELSIQRFRAGTLFKLYFVGFFFLITPFALLGGLASLFGIGTVKLADVELHGWKALVECIFIGPTLALFFAFFTLIGTWPGLWLFSKFSKIEISFYSNDSVKKTVE